MFTNDCSALDTESSLRPDDDRKNCRARHSRTCALCAQRRRQRVAVGVRPGEIAGELRRAGDRRVAGCVHAGQRPVRPQVLVLERARGRSGRARSAHPVEHLEREADLVDGVVAAVAGGVGRMDVEAIARRLRRIRRGRHDLDVQRLRIRELHARDPAHDRDAAKHGRRLLRVREHRQERGLVQDAEALGQVGVRGRARGGDAVDRRQGAVDDAPVRAQQLADRPGRALHDLVDELLGLDVDRRPRGGGEARIDGGVLRGLHDAVDAQPLAHHAHHAIAPGLHAEQPAHLRLAPVRRPERGHRRLQRRIGRAPGDQIRQVGRQLLRRQRDGAAAPGRAERGEVEEPGRLQDRARHQVDAFRVRPGAGGADTIHAPSDPSSRSSRRAAEMPSRRIR